MAINQGLVKGEGSFSYRAPYDRRKPSYNNPTRGAKASAPASTGSLESRSVVRGPGIENDEMDASDDADMVTQTQTPLTANARGPRYTEGSMMDLFTGQRTGTKNADYKADQPITDTNTPYLATKGFWGGIDRVLGNKSNELNEAAQQQQGANWNTANKLKDAQNREDTVTNNANAFTEKTAGALASAQEKAAAARATAEEKAAGALAGTQATAAELADRRKTMAEDRARLEAENIRATDNLRTDAEKTRLRNQALADRIYLRENTLTDQKTANQEKIDAAAAKHGYDVELQQTALGNKVEEVSDGIFTKNGTFYTRDPNNPLNMIPIKLEEPRGSGGNIGPGRSPKNAQGGDANKAAKPLASQAPDAPDNAPVAKSYYTLPEREQRTLYTRQGKPIQAEGKVIEEPVSETVSPVLYTRQGKTVQAGNYTDPAYLSSDDSFVGPSEANPEAAVTPYQPEDYAGIPQRLRDMKKDESRGYELKQDNNLKKSKPRFYIPR